MNMKPDEQKLLQRLCKLLNSLNRTSIWTTEHSLILSYYGLMTGPDRHYHNLGHIKACLELLDELQGEAKDFRRIEAALFFHDVIYVPGARDNEQRSVDFASRFVSGQDIVAIGGLIMATSHVFPWQKLVGDRALIADIDLAILGYGPPKFREYRRQIEFEYLKVFDRSAFLAGSREFFIAMLQQAESDSIYRTASCIDQFEPFAVDNLTLALEQVEEEMQ